MLSGYKFKLILGLGWWLVLIALPANADKIHDPTRPKLELTNDLQPAVTPTLGDEFSLQGIVTKRDRHRAIIGDQLHSVGEQVQGYTLRQIEKNYVVLEKSGSLKRLYVYEK